MNEHDEWRAAINDLDEVARDINTNAHRNALGITGDKHDAEGDNE